MTVRQVAKAVLREVGCEEPDKETLRRVQNAVEASFRKFRGRTVRVFWEVSRPVAGYQ